MLAVGRFRFDLAVDNSAPTIFIIFMIIILLDYMENRRLWQVRPFRENETPGLRVPLPWA
jgi:hypothetical protein